MMAKRGRKPVITEAERRIIYGILTGHGSLDDAAGFLEIDLSTIYRTMHADEDFAKGVKRARKIGKRKLIAKVGKANAWQAAAWLLERRHGKEFGRHDKVDHKHTGAIRLLPMTLDGEKNPKLEDRIGANANGNGNGHHN